MVVQFGAVQIQRDAHMKQNAFGIAAGGRDRLRKAIEARIKKDYQEELAEAADPLKKGSVREKMRRAIREEMKRVASPYALWIRPL